MAGCNPDAAWTLETRAHDISNAAWIMVAKASLGIRTQDTSKIMFWKDQSNKPNFFYLVKMTKQEEIVV
jgi:hypothetical protein